MTGTDLQDLAKKYLSGSATPEEKRRLLEWYDDFGDELLVSIPAEEDESEEGLEARLLARLRASIADEGRVRRARRMLFQRPAVRWAAAAVVLLAIAGWWLIGPVNDGGGTKPVAVQAMAQDVLPGGNKAVLTLAGGQRMVLDSMHTGIVAQQGGAHIDKLADGALSYRPGGGAAAVFNTLSTPRGGQYRLTLADGTNVWLNAASSITYPTAFSGKERRVTVSGEAYFEVAKDKARPFYVKVGEMEVAVLGTSFNINGYADDADIRTTLLEGGVRVNAGKGNAVLRPGQQAVVPAVGQVAGAGGQIAAAGKKIAVEKDVDIAQVMAWKNGVFNFNNMSLQQVMSQLSRWYDVDIAYQGKPEAKRFGGKIGRNLNLSEVLGGLKDMGLHFKIEGKKLIVMP